MWHLGVWWATHHVTLPRFGGRVKASALLFRRKARIMKKVQKTSPPEFKRKAAQLAYWCDFDEKV